MAEASEASASDDRGSSGPVGGSGRRSLAILGALVALAPFAFDTYLPAFPALVRDLDTSTAAVQLTLTAGLLGLGLGQLVGGAMSDAHGRRTPLLFGLVSFAVVSVACALAPSVWALIALRLLQGIGGGFAVAIARAVVRDWHSGAAAARTFGVMMAITGIAPIVAPTIGALVLHATSWRGIFWLLGLIGATVCLAAFLGLPESLPRERRREGGLHEMLGVFHRLALDRRFAGHALACGLPFGAMFAYIAGSPFILQEHFGLSPQEFGLVFGANSLGIVGCSLLSNRLVGRTGPRLLLIAGLVAGLVGAFAILPLVLADAGLWPFLAAQWVMIAAVGLVGPNGTALALADHPDAAGSASALLGMLQVVIGATVAPLVGLGGVDTALPFAIVVVVLESAALGLYAWLAWAPERPSPTRRKEGAWRGSS